MDKGPGLYSDIGKKQRDLLGKDYNSREKNAFTIYSENGETFAASSAQYVDVSSSVVSAQLKGNNVTIDVKLDTNSNLFGMTTVDHELTLGLKTKNEGHCSTKRRTLFISDQIEVEDLDDFDESCVKLERQYLDDYAGISASVGLTPNPTVNFSGVLGNDKLALGSDASFDTKVRAITKCNFEASFTNSDLSAALTLNDKGDTLCASYCLRVTPFTNTALGAEVTHSFSSNKNIVSVGTQHALTSATLVKTRLDSSGRANALIQRALFPESSPKSVITLSTEVDLKSIEKSPKIRLAWAIGF